MHGTVLLTEISSLLPTVNTIVAYGSKIAECAVEF